MAAKFPILCSASLIALALATPAWAQDDAESTDNQIIVTGIRASLGTAQALKEDAIAVTDSIVAEDIGKFPDNTVADALQRVTGIQVQRGAGEAGTVLIRGLPNVTSYINGREVFTGTGRGVALQDIPAELVAGVDVYKTATPDLIEGGVGGRIDIRLRRPFDLEPGITVAGSARALYSDKREKWSYLGSGLVSGRWETEGGQEFGVLLGASYNKRRYRDQTAFNFGWNPFSNAATGEIPAVPPSPGDPDGTPAIPSFVLIPDTVGGLVTDGDRIRPAVNASIQWRPNPDVEWYADGIFTGYRNDFSVNFFVGLPKAGNVTEVETQSGGNVTIPGDPRTPVPAAQRITTRDNFTITSKQAFEQKTDGYQFASGLKVRSDNALFSTEVSYNDSTVASTSYILDVNYIVPRMDYNFNINGMPNIQAFDAAGGAFDLTDPDILDIFALFDQNSLATSKQLAGRADVELEIDSGFVRNFKGGVRLARRTGVSDGTGENRFQIGASGDPYPDLGVRGPTDIIEGRLGVDGFALPGTDFIRDNIDLLRGLAGRPPGAPDFAPTLHFELVEKNYAAYVMAGFDFIDQGLPLEGVIGARVVETKTGLDAILVTTTIVNDAPVTTVTPTSRQRNETNILPNLTLKLRPADDFVLRLVAGRSVTQPEFGQLNPATNVAPGGATANTNVDGSGSGGNPDLRSIKTDNLDISAEWYFNRTGSLTVAGFYRKLNGYIQTYAEVETLPIGDYLISRPRNTGSGNLKGIEVAYQQFFDFLPGFLSGFGAQANFTLADGEVEAPGQPGVMQRVTPISKYSYNLVAMYEKYGFTARLAYNWRDGFLDFYADNIPGGFNQTQSIAFLDFSASYDLTPNVTFTVDATNLLDTTYRDSFGGNPLTPRDTRMYDRTVSFGARFRF